MRKRYEKGGRRPCICPFSAYKLLPKEAKSLLSEFPYESAQNELERDKHYMRQSLKDADYVSLHKQWRAQFSAGECVYAGVNAGDSLSLLNESQREYMETLFVDPKSRELAPYFFGMLPKSKDIKMFNDLLYFLLRYVDTPEFTERVCTSESIRFFLSFTNIPQKEARKIQHALHASLVYDERKKT